MLPTTNGEEIPAYISFLVVWTSVEMNEYNRQLSVYRSVGYTHISLQIQATETGTASTQNTGIYQR